MARPAKITAEQRAIVERVVAMRIAARSIPSDKHLVRMTGLTLRSIRWLVSRMPVSRETHKCELMQDGSSRPDRISVPSRSDQRAL